MRKKGFVARCELWNLGKYQNCKIKSLNYLSLSLFFMAETSFQMIYIYYYYFFFQNEFNTYLIHNAKGLYVRFIIIIISFEMLPFERLQKYFVKFMSESKYISTMAKFNLEKLYDLFAVLFVSVIQAVNLSNYSFRCFLFCFINMESWYFLKLPGVCKLMIHKTKQTKI